MKTFFKLSIIFLLLLTEISCSKDKTKVIQHVDSIPISQAVKITCRDTPDVSYYIYLPSKYDINKNYPVIFIFDPKARGKVSVNLFSEWADKYGYILVGSNNNKNGMDFSTHQNIYNSIYNDVINQGSIDTNRIYLAGFSGGARVAQNIANSNMNIAGIACCEAGCQEPLNRDNKFCYLSFSGYWDFNYIEVKQTEVAFQRAAYQHHFIYFDGKHDWPPKDLIENIFIYFETQNYKNQSKPQISEVIKKEKEKYENKSKVKLSIKEKIQLEKNYNSYFDNILELKKDLFKITDKEYKDFGDSDYKTILSTQQQMEKIMGAINDPGLKWTNTAAVDKTSNWLLTNLKKIGAVIKSNKKDDAWYAAKRVFGTMSLYSYMLAIKAMDAGETLKAKLLIDVYEVVDKENPDLEYLEARNYAATGDKDKAMKALDESFAKGLDDYDRLQNDKFLSKLTDVWDIVDKIKSKYY